MSDRVNIRVSALSIAYMLNFCNSVIEKIDVKNKRQKRFADAVKSVEASFCKAISPELLEQIFAEGQINQMIDDI
jgi:hypothetical protein